jgi:hypothetical protein
VVDLGGLRGVGATLVAFPVGRGAALRADMPPRALLVSVMAAVTVPVPANLAG